MTVKSSLVVHRGVALMLCESAAVLEETLQAVDTSALHLQRVGDRAVVAPAQEIEFIQRALHEQGIFPQVVGEPVRDDDDGSDEEEQA